MPALARAHGPPPQPALRLVAVCSSPLWASFLLANECTTLYTGVKHISYETENRVSWNVESDKGETLQVIAERRQWRLDQLEQTTELLAIMVREAYAEGMEISELARQAQVSRPTIYRWIQHPNLKA